MEGLSFGNLRYLSAPQVGLFGATAFLPRVRTPSKIHLEWNLLYVKSIVEGQAIAHGENLRLSKKLLKQVRGFGYQLRFWLKVGRNIIRRGF